MSDLTLQQALDRDPGYRTTAENLMADRIEELEAEVHRLHTAEFIGRLPDYVKELEGERDEAADEIERLRNHLAELKEWDRM